MLSRRTRPAVLVAGLLLALAALAGCGSSSPAKSSTPSGGGLDNLSVSGDFAKEPTVSWKGAVTAKDLQSKVLITGTGPKLAVGGYALFNVWIGNGTSKQEVYSSFAGSTKTAGGPALPSQAQVSSSLNGAFKKALTDQTVGSRVLVVAPPADAFGSQGSTQLGVSGTDDVVFVVDILSDLAPVSGKAEKAPAWAPKVVESPLKAPSSLDFTGTPKPTGAFQQAVLVRGSGPKVKTGQMVWVRYLGQVYGAPKTFNNTYPSEPFSTELKGNKLIHGWVRGLAGQTVGSRVLLAIPPKLGYGPKGNKDAGIKGTDTLYFVIDILAAA